MRVSEYEPINLEPEVERFTVLGRKDFSVVFQAAATHALSGESQETKIFFPQVDHNFLMGKLSSTRNLLVAEQKQGKNMIVTRLLLSFYEQEYLDFLLQRFANSLKNAENLVVYDSVMDTKVRFGLRCHVANREFVAPHNITPFPITSQSMPDDLS